MQWWAGAGSIELMKKRCFLPFHTSGCWLFSNLLGLEFEARSCQILRDSFEVSLGVQRRHAPGARCRDCLPVNVILNVPTGKDTWHARFRPIMREDVPVRVQLELIAEQRGIRRMPDRYKDATDGNDGPGTISFRPYDTRGDVALRP